MDVFRSINYADSPTGSSMRIGLIAPPWVPVPPPAYGGTEGVIDRLARGLMQAGHEVLLAAAGNSRCPVPRVPGTHEADGAAPASGDATAELAHVIASYAALGNVDVIHDHTVVGPIYSRGRSTPPVVTTNHGPFDDEQSAIFRAMRGVPVVTISHHQASTASADIPIAAVIHHGIDISSVPIGAALRVRELPRPDECGQGPSASRTYRSPGRRATAHGGQTA
jgi:hypothetical protein